MMRGGEEAFGTRGTVQLLAWGVTSLVGGRGSGRWGHHRGWGAAGWRRAGGASGGIAGNLALQPSMKTGMFFWHMPGARLRVRESFDLSPHVFLVL
jgi:hypothetical protein